MMNQEEKTQTATPIEEQQINEPYGVQTSYLSANCNLQGEDHSLGENGVNSNSNYKHDQQLEKTLPSVQNQMSLAPDVSASCSGLANVAQDYSGYAAYSNTDPYGYSSTGYAPYYSQYQQQSNHYQQQPGQYQQQPGHYQQQPGHYQQQPGHYQQQPGHYQQQPGHYQQQPGHYQQQPSQYQQQPNNYQQETNLSYPQQVGAYQNTGAPYQPLSSFQNTGSFGEPASYSSTYYSPGDYQTSGTYTTGTYGTQTNFWHGAPYTNYTSHQYSNYTPDSNSAYGSTTTVATSQYQQQYKQWEGYYSQSPTEVTCAPGTENISVSIPSTVSSFVPSQDNVFPASNNQMPAAYTSVSRPESSSSEFTSMQPVAMTGSVPEGYWKHDATTFHSDPSNLIRHAHKASELNPTYESFRIEHNNAHAQGSASLHTTYYHVSQTHQPTFQTVSQPLEPPDSRKACKLQIPTNPRIVPTLPLTLSRMDKDSSVGSTTLKPAYVSVSTEKSNENIRPHEEADSTLKPGTFPKSLRGYVERALARCKNDMQKAACQTIMKEIITNATADGTLHTRDWDTEPLFPLPISDMANEAKTQFSVPIMPKSKSPSRRSKSRWEPVQEVKTVEKSTNTYIPTEYGFRSNKQFSGGQIENKDHLGTKFSFTDQKSFSRNAARPAKRQRVGNEPNAANNGEMSSDSDKEQNLTKYYSAAITLNNTPEEKKRRENRSKRFEKKHVNQTERNNAKVNAVGAGQLHVRPVGALFISKSFEESGSRAVEDIDWDALVIKGTCQEIEKRYLRLTSAPDPAMVRPEEVLEKALVMVQNSDKNYLYKCDQLKSMRQDLTVQHIRNELTVKVYEIHARLAIEAGDLPEYNQCQSQLKTLYAEGIFGCHMEFSAYNLLCEILHSNNHRDLLLAMSRLSEKTKKDKAVQHALSVRTAVTSGNYVMFFRLYSSAPNLNAFFMDLYVEKMRYAAVKCMSRSYRPMVPVLYLSQILGFSNALPTSEVIDGKEVGGLEECIEWLRAHGACLMSDSSGETLFDTKASVSSLYMPEPEDAVSHGDTSLAVNDFFTRSSS